MEYLDIRKNAYIEALTLSETGKVISLWGRVPWEIVESFGYKGLYSYGIDKHVTEGYDDNNYCDMLNSSFAYLELSKCPFMFSSKFFIVDDNCKIRYEKLKEKTDKEVYLYRNNDYKSLIKFMEEKSKEPFNMDKFVDIVEKSKQISSAIGKLRKCDVDEKRIYEVEYFSKFIFDVDERLSFIRGHIDESFKEKEVAKIQAGAGIYKKIVQLINEGYFCEGELHKNYESSGFEFIEEKYGKFNFKPDYIIRGCNQFDIDNKTIKY